MRLWKLVWFEWKVVWAWIEVRLEEELLLFIETGGREKIVTFMSNFVGQDLLCRSWHKISEGLKRM